MNTNKFRRLWGPRIGPEATELLRRSVAPRLIGMILILLMLLLFFIGLAARFASLEILGIVLLFAAMFLISRGEHFAKLAGRKASEMLGVHVAFTMYSHHYRMPTRKVDYEGWCSANNLVPYGSQTSHARVMSEGVIAGSHKQPGKMKMSPWAYGTALTGVVSVLVAGDELIHNWLIMIIGTFGFVAILRLIGIGLDRRHKSTSTLPPGGLQVPDAGEEPLPTNDDCWEATSGQAPSSFNETRYRGRWHPDPTGRFPQRYFDGFTWTAWVIDQRGIEIPDPHGAPSLPAP